MPDTERLREIFSHFGPGAVIDVLILAAAIFGLLRLLSGTRAMTQVRGALVIIVLGVFLGRLFDLTAVNFLVDRGASVVVLGAVVVFQPEIRRALDRMGRTTFGPRLAEPQSRATVRAIAEAAGDLASHRHGALMVIARETGLQDISEGGVRLDSRVSSELLANIFFPNSPLHDMAAVIREDRVVAAGCVLPLSDVTEQGGRALGTRHRAALGISEATDAVAVVVSEETGDVSLALGGRLTRVADRQRLESILLWLLESERPAVPAAGAAGTPG